MYKEERDALQHRADRGDKDAQDRVDRSREAGRQASKKHSTRKRAKYQEYRENLASGDPEVLAAHRTMLEKAKKKAIARASRSSRRE